MKKKVIIGICVVLVICLLIPIPMRMKDGGTVVYAAALYQVEDVHRIHAGDSSEEVSFIEGTIIRVLGIEIYNNVPQY